MLKRKKVTKVTLFMSSLESLRRKLCEELSVSQDIENYNIKVKYYIQRTCMYKIS